MFRAGGVGLFDSAVARHGLAGSVSEDIVVVERVRGTARGVWLMAPGECVSGAQTEALMARIAFKTRVVELQGAGTPPVGKSRLKTQLAVMQSACLVWLGCNIDRTSTS